MLCYIRQESLHQSVAGREDVAHSIIRVYFYV